MDELALDEAPRVDREPVLRAARGAERSHVGRTHGTAASGEQLGEIVDDECRRRGRAAPRRPRRGRRRSRAEARRPRPAATPDTRVLDDDRIRGGSTPSCSAASRYMSGAGLPATRSVGDLDPSTTTSNRCGEAGRAEHAAGVLRRRHDSALRDPSAFEHVEQGRATRGTGRCRHAARISLNSCVLAVAERAHGARPARRPAGPRAASIVREARNARTPS